MKIQQLSQRDPAWSEHKMPPTNIVIGKMGCLTTVLSMISDLFGCYRNPADFADNCVKYDAQGNVLWGTLKTCFKLEKRLVTLHENEIDKSLKDPNRAVAIQVEGRHWLWVIGKVPVIKRMNGQPVYKVIDPWFGDRAYSNRYKTISGSAHMIKV